MASAVIDSVLDTLFAGVRNVAVHDAACPCGQALERASGHCPRCGVTGH